MSGERDILSLLSSHLAYHECISKNLEGNIVLSGFLHPHDVFTFTCGHLS